MLVFTSTDKCTTVTASAKCLNDGIRLSMPVYGSIKTKRKGATIYVSDKTGVIGTVKKKPQA